MDRKNELLFRVYVILAAFLIFAALIVWQLVNISLVEGDKWRAEKEKTYLKWRPVKAQRGEIYSDDGIRMLASSIEFFEIRMDPVSPSDQVFNEGIDGLCKGLEQLLKTRSASDWKKKIVSAKKKGKKYLLINRKVNDEMYNKLKKLPIFEKGKYKGGFIVNRFYSRKKTYKEMASRTIGEYREKNMVGIERKYDKILRGEERKELMRFMPPDLWIPMHNPTEFETIRGRSVVTTIDVNIQNVVHHELMQGLAENGASGGVAVIMDTETGYIKAMSNLDLKDGVYRELDNKAVKERTEPGSTFKAATLLALLEAGVDEKTSVRIDRGKKRFFDLDMYDSNYPHDEIMSDLGESFVKSSNVGIATLTNDRFNSKERRKEGRREWHNLLAQFGLIDKTGIDLLGEPEPFIKDPEKNASTWSGVTIPWMAHGYELQLTPIQILAFYNAIANGGNYYKPRLVKAIKEGEEVLRQYKPESKRTQIASPENIAIVQELMTEVVMRGTGKNIYSNQYGIAGKTGTAAVNYNKGDQKDYNASFAGFFPAEAPRYSMIVVAYGLKGNKYYGSQVAGPVFKSIADRIIALDGGLDIAYTHEDAFPRSSKGFGGDFEDLYGELSHTGDKKYPRWARIDSEGTHTIAQKALIRKSEIPDVKGMGLRDALYVLENLGMKVEAHGAGKVYKQSQRAGKKLGDNSIEIYLN